MLFCNVCFMYKLRKVFTIFKMNIMTEASKLMPEDQFYDRGSKFENAISTCILKARISLK